MALWAGLSPFYWRFKRTGKQVRARIGSRWSNPGGTTEQKPLDPIRNGVGTELGNAVNSLRGPFDVWDQDRQIAQPLVFQNSDVFQPIALIDEPDRLLDHVNWCLGRGRCSRLPDRQKLGYRNHHHHDRGLIVLLEIPPPFPGNTYSEQSRHW